MDDDEGDILVGMLAGAYRQDLGKATQAVYKRMLADLPFELAEQAALRVIATQKFFPSVSELRAAVVDHLVALPTPEQAWHQVEQLLAKFPSYPDAVWVPPLAPHPLVWRVVQDLGGLYSLAKSDTDMADRAHFLKLYADLREQEMIQAIASPVAYLEAQGPELAKMDAWQQGNALAAAKPPLALPAVASPPPPEFREALARLTERTRVSALLPAEGEVARG